MSIPRTRTRTRTVPTPPALVALGRSTLQRARSLPLFWAAVGYAWLAQLRHLVRCRLGRRPADAGMTTAEYAVGTVAACGFAALLYKIVTSGAVSAAVSALIKRALGAV